MIHIESWNESLDDAQKMCDIESHIAHDYIPDPKSIMQNWSVRDTNYYRDKLIAYKDRLAVGCIHIIQGRKENSHIAYFDFYVHPQYQHKGIGTQLYNDFVNRVKNVGCTHVHSFVYDHPNWKSGKSFFAKYGFEHISTNREYVLKLQDADFSEYISLVDDVKSQGYTFIEPVHDGINSDEHYKKLEEIRTDNEENNPMYKINVSLGFDPVPFSLEYMKEL